MSINILRVIIVTALLSSCCCRMQKIPSISYSFFYGPPSPESFRSDFISYKDCLFEFKLNYTFDNVINTGINTEKNNNFDSSAPGKPLFSYDTTGVIVTFKNGSQYIEFDRFAKDAFIKSKGDAVTASPGMKYTASPGQMGNLGNIFFKATDTTIGNAFMKKIDTIVEENGFRGMVSFYYIQNKHLITVFNIRDQIKNINNDYCFAGYFFYTFGQKQPEGVIISGIKEPGEDIKVICKSLYDKARSIK
jgi:hypothetical protein